MAWQGLALIVRWVPTNSFAAESVIAMNLPVLLFSSALAVVTAIVFGVWPALQLSRAELGRVVLAVAVMACLAPARRAASIDPMDAVRHE